MTFSPHVDPTPARGATVADASYHAEVPGFPPSLNTPLQGEEAEFSGSSLFGPDNGQSPSWGFKPSRLHLGLSPSGYSDGSSVASPGHALPASEPAMIYDVRAASCVAPPSPSPAIVHPAIKAPPKGKAPEGASNRPLEIAYTHKQKLFARLAQARETILSNPNFNDILTAAPLKQGIDGGYKAEYDPVHAAQNISLHGLTEASGNMFDLDIFAHVSKGATMSMKHVTWLMNHFWKEPSAIFPHQLTGVLESKEQLPHVLKGAVSLGRQKFLTSPALPQLMFHFLRYESEGSLITFNLNGT